MAGFRQHLVGESLASLHIREDIAPPALGLAFGIWQKRGVMRAGVTPLYPGDLTKDGRLDDAVGQYAVISLSGGQHQASIAVSTDDFGLVPIFYFKGASGSLVSNRIHLILEKLRQHGHPITVNFPALYSRCFVDKSICMQATTAETIYDGIRMTLPWEHVEIDNRGLHLHGAPPEHAQLSMSEYNDLIVQGAQEIRDNIRAALDSNAFPRVASTLTGGRDSRVIFAALASLGQVSAVPFQTRPLDDDDVNVATALVHAFGGRYDSMPSAGGDIPDAGTHLLTHRSVFMGQYSDLKRTPKSAPAPGLRLIGGCGETYRSFYSKQYSDALIRRSFDRQAVREFLLAHSFWKIYSTEIFDQVEQILFTNLESLRGDTLGEKLEDHYFAFRNRLHFGTAGTYRNPVAPVYQPLVSPSLMRASRGLPLAVRLSGRVIYDVTATLSPEVAHFPYAGKPLTDFSSVPYHVDRTRGMSVKPFEPRPDLLVAASAAKRAAAVGRPAKTKASGRPDVERLVESTLPMLRDAEGFNLLVTDKLASRVAWLRSSRSKFYRVWGSRVSAMGDALEYARAR